MSKRQGTGPEDRAAETAITARMREFYERVRFPGIRPPDQDGLILMRRLARRASRGSGRTHVLDAGCGTGNTCLSLARRFPDFEFLGLDLAAPSLELARAAAAREGLENIRFRQWDLMRPMKDGQRFEIVLCLGVLHHTADLRAVLANLHAVLDDDGELYLWVYGRHGRYRHALNRKLLRVLLEARPGEGDAVALAREFIRTPREREAVRNDLKSRIMDTSTLEKLLDDPAWVADQFLNPREVLLDMAALSALLSDAGFTLFEWLGVNPDLAAHFRSPELVARFKALPGRQQLIALDLWLKPERYFIVAKKSPNLRGGA